nr:MAG TPA: hypothetical protein [Caudoviricetes sp.]
MIFSSCKEILSYSCSINLSASDNLSSKVSSY